tara:strand:+ start:766 stop:1233 length:468 start_codon:yes stop_codon:yes gene_type:complete
MAATSTNKQPLLVDRVLHYVTNLDAATVGSIDITGTNTAIIIVDSTQLDGAIIEDIYSIARSTNQSTINLYISSQADYLRPNEGILVGQFTSATTIGSKTSWDGMPKILAPMPQTGTDTQFKALYLPKGKALWAARESSSIATDGPLLGVQGGWY